MLTCKKPFTTPFTRHPMGLKSICWPQFLFTQKMYLAPLQILFSEQKQFSCNTILTLANKDYSTMCCFFQRKKVFHIRCVQSRKSP